MSKAPIYTNINRGIWSELPLRWLQNVLSAHRRADEADVSAAFAAATAILGDGLGEATKGAIVPCHRQK